MKRTITIIFILCSAMLRSQELKKQHNYSTVLWLGYFNRIKLNGNLAVVTDVQFRTKNELKQAGQFLIRSGLQYRPNEKFSFIAGLAHFRYFINNDKTRGEWRPWQEIAIRDEYEKLSITHRFRIEERFNQQVKGKQVLDEYVFNFRFRYKVDLQYPLFCTKNKVWKGTLGNEVMLNAGRSVKFNCFDQNRLSVGLLIECSPGLALQPQYIFVSQQLADGLSINQTSVVRMNIVQKF